MVWPLPWLALLLTAGAVVGVGGFAVDPLGAVLLGLRGWLGSHGRGFAVLCGA